MRFPDVFPAKQHTFPVLSFMIHNCLELYSFSAKILISTNFRRCMIIVSGKSLLSVFPVSLISAPMPESAELRTCPRDFTWNEKTNKCYKFTNDRITWRMAREKCRNLGADLVSVQSQKEQRFIVDTARNSKGENYDFRFLFFVCVNVCRQLTLSSSS